MGSLRTGKVLDAVSQGIGLFAARSAKKEDDKAERDWDMALANMRTKAAQEIQKENFAHDERMAAQKEAGDLKRDELATKRYEATTAATSSYHSAVLTQAERQEATRRADLHEQSLRAELAGNEKLREKALEKLREFGTKEQKDEVRAYFSQLNANAIQSSVASGSEKGLKGYEITSENELRNLYSRMGMGSALSKIVSKEVWAQGTGFDPDAPAPYKPDGIIDATGQPVSEVDMPIGSPGAAAPAQPAQPAPGAAPQAQQNPMANGDLFQPGAAAPSAGERRAAAGSSQYGSNPNYNPNPFKDTPLFNSEARARNERIGEEFLRKQQEQMAGRK
jgi:hypothetical protein